MVLSQGSGITVGITDLRFQSRGPSDIPSVLRFEICDLKSFYSPQERPHNRRVRPGNHVGADQLADAAGGLGAGFDGGADAADVAADESGHEGAADADA